MGFEMSRFTHFICVIQSKVLMFVQPNPAREILGLETNWNTQLHITGIASLNPEKFKIQDQASAPKTGFWFGIRSWCFEVWTSFRKESLIAQLLANVEYI